MSRLPLRIWAFICGSTHALWEIGILADEICPSTEKALIESTQVNFKTHQVNIALLFHLGNVFSYYVLTHLI